MNEQALVTAIVRTALEGVDGDVSGHRAPLWIAGKTLLAGVLREVDPFTRERLLHLLVSELRGSADRISHLLQPPARTLN
jgi:hypothetical protein